MSRVANRYDNAKAESLMKILKAEEVNGKAYATLAEAPATSASSSKPSTTPSACTRRSALRYKPPVEFEAELSLSTNHRIYGNIAVSLN